MAASAAPFDIQGKTAIVTGAGSGINFAFAQLLLSNGCNVLIADLSLRPEAEKYYSSFSSSPRAVSLKTDVTSWSALEAMFTEAYAQLGSVDILCPGAGLFDPPFSNFWFPPGCKESRDDARGDTYKVLDVNITHPIRSSQLAISHWLNPPNGHEKVSPSNPKRIIFISSVAGQLHGIPYPLYFASKHAISAFVRSLGALDKQLGIRVAAVAPGPVSTPMLLEDQHKFRTVDLQRDGVMTPEKIAELMYKLCVDERVEGGSIFEITESGTREVGAFNDPGPQGGRHTSHFELNLKEVWERLGQQGWGLLPG